MGGCRAGGTPVDPAGAQEEKVEDQRIKVGEALEQAEEAALFESSSDDEEAAGAGEEKEPDLVQLELVGLPAPGCPPPWPRGSVSDRNRAESTHPLPSFPAPHALCCFCLLLPHVLSCLLPSPCVLRLCALAAPLEVGPLEVGP